MKAEQVKKDFPRKSFTSKMLLIISTITVIVGSYSVIVTWLYMFSCSSTFGMGYWAAGIIAGLLGAIYILRKFIASFDEKEVKP